MATAAGTGGGGGRAPPPASPERAPPPPKKSGQIHSHWLAAPGEEFDVDVVTEIDFDVKCEVRSVTVRMKKREQSEENDKKIWGAKGQRRWLLSEKPVGLGFLSWCVLWRLVVSRLCSSAPAARVCVGESRGRDVRTHYLII